MYEKMKKPKQKTTNAPVGFTVQKKSVERSNREFLDNRTPSLTAQKMISKTAANEADKATVKQQNINRHPAARQLQSNIIQRLTDDEIQAKYNQDMNRMSPSQQVVIQDIITIDGWQAFRGGHVVINSPDFFLKWMALDTAKRKQGILKGSLGSSHYTDRDAEQFEIQLPNFWFGNNWGTVLFGSDDNQTSTWFQIEGHSGVFVDSYTRFFTDVLMHGADFIKHKRYGLSLFGWDVVNVGPFGTDEASEKSDTHRLIQ